MRIYMDTKRARWIAGFLDKLDLTQTEFGDELGVSQSTVSRWLKGQKPDIDHWLALVALAARHEYPVPDRFGKDAVPVIGYVGAGAEIFVWDDHAQGAGFDEILAPYGTAPAIGLIVRGPSMYPRYEDGDIIVCSDIDHDPVSLIGRDCYVKLLDGRAFLKRLRQGSEPGRFTLRSHNAPDIENVQLDKAYPVEWVRPHK